VTDEEILAAYKLIARTEGIFVEPIIESGEIIEPLRDRIVGRVSLEKIKDYEGNIIVDINQEITEELASELPSHQLLRVCQS
jgi:DNA-directed RNA polymerase subunit beta'